MSISMNNNQKMFRELQQQIDAAEKVGKPVKDFVLQQIALLKNVHDEFIKTATSEGYELTNPKIGEIQVRQFSVMKQLAKKVGLPIEEYDNMIKEIRIRIFGEENYKRFFESNN